MFFRQPYRRFAARAGLFAAVLAMAQAASGWHAQPGDGRYAQRGEAAPAQIVESQWGRIGQAGRPDRKTDSPALAPSDLAPTAHRFREGLIPGSSAIADRVRAVVLPGIRAPPLHATST